MTRAAAGPLSALVPTSDEAALLRACLSEGTDAADGWREWCECRAVSRSELLRELAKWRLLPLLAWSVDRSDIDVGREVRDYLRAMSLREDLRASRYRRILAELLAHLEAHDVAAFVSRGPALAGTVYDNWSLRHCHDIDILVSPQDLEAAAALLHPGRARLIRRSTKNALFQHHSGLPIAIHTHPLGPRHLNGDLEVFVTPNRRIPIENGWMVIPSVEALLVHVLGHATYSPRRHTLRWVTDAWMILARCQSIDWQNVLARVAKHRLDLALSILFEYLVSLDAPIPAHVRDQLAARARQADRQMLEAAIGDLVCAYGKDLTSFWRRTPTWAGRLSLARWAAAPSAAYLRRRHNTAPRGVLSLYLNRPLRFFARSMRK